MDNQILGSLEKLASEYGLVSREGNEFFLRPAISWGLVDERFYLRYERDEYARVLIGFRDEDTAGQVWQKDGRYYFFERQIAVRLNGVAIKPEDIDEICSYLVHNSKIELTKLIRDINSLWENDNRFLDVKTYTLSKWISRRDDYLLGVLVKRYADLPLIRKVARLLGREEDYSRLLRNKCAARELTA